MVEENKQNEEKRTLTISKENWKFLAQYKLDHNIDTFDGVIEALTKDEAKDDS